MRKIEREELKKRAVEIWNSDANVTTRMISERLRVDMQTVSKWLRDAGVTSEEKRDRLVIPSAWNGGKTK
jgi:Mn-dependent DtxR family transcriptional regulator